MTTSVCMVIQSEQKQNNLDTPEIQSDNYMRTCPNDVTVKIARPLIISMRLFGLLHLPGKETVCAQITRIYSRVVLLAMWLMVIKLFTVYGSQRFGRDLIIKIVVHSLTCLSAVAATSTYMACQRQNKLVEFLAKWPKLMKLHNGCDKALANIYFDRYVKKAKLSFNLFFVISWLSVFVAWGFVGYCVFMTSLVNFLLHPMDPNHPQAMLLKLIVFVVYIYICAAWVFTLCLFYSIVTVIYEEFRIFHLDFQRAVQPNGNIACIGNYRRRHQKICLLLENADDILSGFNAFGILFTMIYGMMVLYKIIWYPDQYKDVVIFTSNIFWLLSCLLYLGVIGVGGGYLNHMAHSPLKTIHNIQLKTLTAETSLQMTMFLSKLTGESIGLTAMGVFVIDKPTILTIAGAFLTYFVVLLQFQQPTGLREDLWNCTAPV